MFGDTKYYRELRPGLMPDPNLRRNIITLNFTALTFPENECLHNRCVTLVLVSKACVFSHVPCQVGRLSRSGNNGMRDIPIGRNGTRAAHSRPFAINSCHWFGPPRLGPPMLGHLLPGAVPDVKIWQRSTQICGNRQCAGDLYRNSSNPGNRQADDLNAP